MIYSLQQVQQMNRVEIDEAIRKLEDLHRTLVGTLYPGVVLQELDRLEQRRKELQCMRCC